MLHVESAGIAYVDAPTVSILDFRDYILKHMTLRSPYDGYFADLCMSIVAFNVLLGVINAWRDGAVVVHSIASDHL